MSWPLVKIGDFCITGSGGTPSRTKSEYFEGDIPWIKSGDLRENIVINATEFISKEAVKNSSAKMVAKGSILLAMYGATVGRMALLGIDATTNQAVCNITPDSNIAFTKYVYYALLSKVPEFLKNAVGGAQPNISQGIIRETQIPLPPLAEQKRIAAILDKADAIRRKRQQAIKLADEFLRSVFLDMFGDPVTNPKGWEVVTLGDLIHFATDGPHVSPKYSESGVPFLSTRHIKPNGVEWEDLKFISSEDADSHWKKCKPSFGDVLYTKGGTTGIACPVDFNVDFAVWVHVALLRPIKKKADFTWLAYILNSAYCYAQSQQYTRGATNKDLGLKRMVDIKLYLPPLELQDRFSTIKRKIDRLVADGKHSSKKKLFESLSQKAFSGSL